MVYLCGVRQIKGRLLINPDNTLPTTLVRTCSEKTLVHGYILKENPY